jgi:hypothetical protein
MDQLPLIASILASAAACLALGHRVVVQLMARIDGLAATLRAEMASQFETAERNRQENAGAYRAAWDARHEALHHRVEELHHNLQALRGQFDDERKAVADAYVARETWLEHVGGLNIRLDRLAKLIREHTEP